MESKVRSKFRRVCVFCGSTSGNREIFGDAALDLRRELVNRKIDLVFGGGSVGLMGLISQTLYDGGCHVLGIIPTALMPAEAVDNGVKEGIIRPAARDIVLSVPTARNYTSLHEVVVPPKSWES